MSKKDRQDESGVYLIYTAIAMFSLLAVAGLGLDVGNLERHKMRVQRAVDATVVPMTWMLRTEPASSIRAVGLRHLQDNLNAMDVQFSPSDLSVQVWDSNDIDISNTTQLGRYVTIEARIQSPVYLLNIVPFINVQPTVNASTRADDIRVHWAFAIDRSGSMCEDKKIPNPGHNPNLDCCDSQAHSNSCSFGTDYRNTCDPPALPGQPRSGPCNKLERAKDAVINFVQRLGADDSFALISFGSSATIDFPLQTMSATEKARAINAVRALRAPWNQSTRLEGGLDEAYKQLERLRRSGTLGTRDRLAVVVLSDGRGRQRWTPNDILPGSCTASLPSGCGRPTLTRQLKEVNLTAIYRADRARAMFDIFTFFIGFGKVAEWYVDADPRDPWTGWDYCQPHPSNGNWGLNEEFVPATLGARIALDMNYLSNMPPPPPPSGQPPTVQVPGQPSWFPDFEQPHCNAIIKTIQQAAQDGEYGRFFQTANPSDVQAILDEIGSSVRVVITQ